MKSFPYVLAELSKCEELLNSISHLVIWWYPEDYIGLNSSIKQDFSKRTKYRKEICIESVPTDIFGSDLVLLFNSDPVKRMIDNCIEGISPVEHRRNLFKILQFAKRCKNLKGLHWKETQSYHNVNDTFDYLLEIVDKNRHLKHLTLCNFGKCGIDYNALLQKCPRLTSLDLTLSQNVTDKTIGFVSKHCNEYNSA